MVIGVKTVKKKGGGGGGELGKGLKDPELKL